MVHVLNPKLVFHFEPSPGHYYSQASVRPFPNTNPNPHRPNRQVLSLPKKSGLAVPARSHAAFPSSPAASSARRRARRCRPSTAHAPSAAKGWVRHPGLPPLYTQTRPQRNLYCCPQATSPYSTSPEPTSVKGRGSEELSAELSVALQRCLLGGKSGAGAAIDLSSLIVVDGKVCWDLYIDGLVVSSNGNLLDALATAIKVALSDTGIPKVTVSVSAASDDEPEVDVSDEEFLQFDTSRVPVIITLTKVGRQYIVDATSEEESQMSSAVSVSVNRHGHICGLTKRGGAGLDPTVIFDMISVAKHVSQQFIALLDSEIVAAQAEE